MDFGGGCNCRLVDGRTGGGCLFLAEDGAESRLVEGRAGLGEGLSRVLIRLVEGVTPLVEGVSD